MVVVVKITVKCRELVSVNDVSEEFAVSIFSVEV